MLAKLTSYLKNSFFVFAKSFLVRQSFVYSALFDAVYWFLTFLTAVLTKNLLVGEIQKLQYAVPSAEILVNETVAKSTAGMLKWYFIDSGLIIALAVVLQIITYSLCKGFIWLCLTDKKVSREFFVGFFKLNLLWWLVWLLPAVILAFGLKPSFVFVGIFVFLIYVHLTGVLHLWFARTQNIRSSFAAVLSVGVGSFHKFIVPYIFAFLVYLAASKLFLLLPKDQKSMLMAGIIFVVFYLAWFRQYLYTCFPRL